jgi:hypothetical protein
MIVILKHHTLILAPEEAQEVETLANWQQENRGRVFASMALRGSGYVIASLGQREEPCREPVSINSRLVILSGG